ncbi:type II toxin-antitoxin system HicB family antitoxin [candidate division KSB1 bacterium]|nr:type II toxin-antitoxin system HicB family antitoxin [candidate division KSB1 bacterium]
MTVNVLVQPNPEKGYTATVLGWADLVVEAQTKEEALEKVRAELANRLAKGEIISLQIEPANGEHPWMKFAGMWKDDSMFDEVLEDIKAYRKKIDKEWNQA